MTGCWEVAAPPALSFVVDTKALLKAATKPMGTVLHGNPWVVSSSSPATAIVTLIAETVP